MQKIKIIEIIHKFVSFYTTKIVNPLNLINSMIENWFGKISAWKTKIAKNKIKVKNEITNKWGAIVSSLNNQN